MPQPLNRYDQLRLKRQTINSTIGKRFKLGSFMTEKLIFNRLKRFRIEDITNIEQTFSIILTSTPIAWGNKSMESRGGTWPNINEQDILSAGSISFLDENFFNNNVHLRVQIKNDPNLNFDIDYPGTHTSHPEFKFKRNRRYRFDLSHPSLSVNENNPYPNYRASGLAYSESEFDSSLEEILPIYGEKVLNKFNLYKNKSLELYTYSLLETHSLSGNFNSIINEVYYLSSFNNFILNEGVFHNGVPGTPGAYLDIVTHDKLPSSLTLYNSALPTNFTNSNPQSGYLYRRHVPDSKNINEFDFLSNGIEISLYDDINDDFIVEGSISSPSSSNYVYVGNHILSTSNAFEYFDFSSKFLDTRTRTITSFKEKVLKKIKTGNPKNLLQLSALKFQFDHFKTPETFFTDTKIGKLHYTKTNYISDYFNCIIRNSNNTLSAWNPNWWGYEARDVLNFSGVCMDHDGANTNQFVLFTPKHCIGGGHWANSSHPHIGEKMYFLEHNTGKRVSARVLDIINFNDGFNKTDARKLRSIPGFENQNTFHGDLMIFKLDRDLTTPDPDVEGSDGSVKYYKIPRYNEPFFYNDYPEDWFLNLYRDHVEMGAFLIYGSDLFTHFPGIGLFGLGAFGRTTYGRGDEFVRMNLIDVDLYRHKDNYNNLFNSNSGVSVRDSNKTPLDNDYNNYEIFGDDKFFKYEGGNGPLLRLGDGSGAASGDSSNPNFLIIETSDNELELIGPVNMTTSSVLGPARPSYAKTFYPPYGEFSGLSGYASIDNLVNALMYEMSGGNPEGYTVSVVDIT
mgnify:CR=1 FL=1